MQDLIRWNKESLTTYQKWEADAERKARRAEQPFKDLWTQFAELTRAEIDWFEQELEKNDKRLTEIREEWRMASQEAEERT